MEQTQIGEGLGVPEFLDSLTASGLLTAEELERAALGWLAGKFAFTRAGARDFRSFDTLPG